MWQKLKIQSLWWLVKQKNLIPREHGTNFIWKRSSNFRPELMGKTGTFFNGKQLSIWSAYWQFSQYKINISISKYIKCSPINESTRV